MHPVCDFSATEQARGSSSASLTDIGHRSGQSRWLQDTALSKSCGSIEWSTELAASNETKGEVASKWAMGLSWFQVPRGSDDKNFEKCYHIGTAICLRAFSSTLRFDFGHT